MKTQEYDGNEVRSILIAMITNSAVISRIAGQWRDEGLFEQRWANLVAGWAVRHYREYSVPIEGVIESVYDSWTQSERADAEVEAAIANFLGQLSTQADDQKKETSEYYQDLAAAHFNSVAITQLADSLKADVERGKVERAEERLNLHRRVELGVGSYVKPFSDFAEWNEAFQDMDRSRSLLRYSGAAGEFFDHSFYRKEFYAFMGPDKTGKTTFLVDATYRVLRANLRVAFFDTGDGDKEELFLKLGCRATNTTEFGGAVEVPECFPDIPDDPEQERDWKPLKIKKRLQKVDSLDAFRTLRKMNGEENFRVSCHPNSTLSANGLGSILVDWSREDNWRPDVVIVDYADILAAPSGIKDSIEQINENWKTLRRISQSQNILLLTATQSNSASYGLEKSLLSRRNFSGSKGKLAHPNGIIGINVADDERELEVARLNWVVRRKLRNRDKKFVRIAGTFDTYNPVLISE